MLKSRLKVEGLVLPKVTTQQDKAQALLNEWHRFRASGACAFIFEIQEGKDRLENLATKLTAELYCADTDELGKACSLFESELDRLKQKVYVDLIAGLKKTNDK